MSPALPAVESRCSRQVSSSSRVAAPVVRRVRIRDPSGMSSSRRSLSRSRPSPLSTTHSRPGVEPGAGKQSQLRQYHRRHLLGLIDEDDGPAGSGLQVIEPSSAQRFEPTPAVADPDGDREDVAELTVEVAQVTLRMMDDPTERSADGTAARQAAA